MITVEIDLATQPSKTAACVIDWTARPVVTDLLTTVTDDDAVSLVLAADRCAIDAPFGWPEAFVRLVVAHQAGAELPDGEVRLRETDHHVKRVSGVTPLSVAADKLGATAVRCARLLHEIGARDGEVDRAGTGKVVEAYPAAALRMWGLPSQGYKGGGGLPARERLLQAVLDRVSLDCRAEYIQTFSKSDDAFDSLVCALIARMVANGNSIPPASSSAAVEGWIHLPLPGLGLESSVRSRWVGNR